MENTLIWIQRPTALICLSSQSWVRKQAEDRIPANFKWLFVMRALQASHSFPRSFHKYNNYSFGYDQGGYIIMVHMTLQISHTDGNENHTHCVYITIVVAIDHTGQECCGSEEGDTDQFNQTIKHVFMPKNKFHPNIMAIPKSNPGS